MSESVIGVYSWEHLDTVLEAGGSGWWFAGSLSLASCKYILIVRNGRRADPEAEDGYSHSQPFLLGKVSGYHRHHEGRALIKISEYFQIPNQEEFKNNAWEQMGLDAPRSFRYLNTDNLLSGLGLDVNKLEWIPMPKKDPSQELDTETPAKEVNSEEELMGIIDEFRENISEFLQISKEKIQINITL